VEEIDEWCVDFVLFSTHSTSKHHLLVDKVIMSAVAWAESKGLCIGGGFKVDRLPIGSFSKHTFGLSAPEVSRPVPRQSAQELFEHIANEAISVQLKINGGFRSFCEIDNG
jgi:hypothetical protein